MIKRRDVLKFAAAIGAGRMMTPRMTAAEAAKSLSDEYAVPGKNWHGPLELNNVATFSERGVGLLIETLRPLEGLIEDSVAVELAAFHQARANLVKVLPCLEQFAYPSPWALLDETMTPLYSSAFDAGLRIGAEMEHLRLALTTPKMNCSKCWGMGTLEADGSADIYLKQEMTCPKCDGHGHLVNPEFTRRD